MGFSASFPALGGSGCGAQAAPAFGGFPSCGNSAISRSSSASSYTLPTLPTLQLPTFPAPSMALPLPLGTNAPAYAVAPTENESGASPSYTPISSHSPAQPPIPPSASYADLGHVDTVAKGKTVNEITGVDSPTDKVVQTSSSSPGSDFYEEKVPNIEDYGDLTSTSNRSGNDEKKNDLLTADYSDQSFAKTKVSGVPSDLMTDQDSTGDPKCSSETLKTIMQENIVSSPTISKQLIFSAGRIAFGQTIDVICSRNKLYGR
ncbi:hypothetical protein M3Y98_00127800 [Aphelenchoides besseyi]|nr:hypothetical protein M3Y98_00127800 [Aphelenchoides besseyi]